MNKRNALIAAAGIGAGVIAREIVRRRTAMSFAGKVVLITGGSRGLGLSLARAFAKEGAHVAICARDAAELEWARRDLVGRGAQVLTVQCDVADQMQVELMVESTRQRFGRIDVLVNNAGTIQVGPVENMSIEDFERAMESMFWGVVYPTMAALPHLRQAGDGRIVNITSIGGKVAVPHLLPYTCAKFAAVGFSEGLAAELARERITVTTIAPGLMRTGSYLNALFSGNQEQEGRWFSLGSTLPGISMNAERAAAQIVAAARRGTTEKILTMPANLLARFHGLFPGLTTDIMGLVNRVVLPDSTTPHKHKTRGAELRTLRSPLMASLTVLGRLAAKRFHQPA